MRIFTTAFLITLAPLATASAASVHTDVSSFLDSSTNVALGDFSDVDDGLAPWVGLDFTSESGYALNINGYYDRLFNQDGVISTNIAGDFIVIQFTGDDVSAVGGNLWGTDVDFGAISASLSVVFSDGAAFEFLTSSPDAFLGYISDESLDWLAIGVNTIEDGEDDAFTWATLDNLLVGQNTSNVTAVPLPAPGLLAFAGLATLTTRRRR